MCFAGKMGLWVLHQMLLFECFLLFALLPKFAVRGSCRFGSLD